MEQGSSNIVVRGPHQLLHNSSRAIHLNNAIVSAYVACYQINNFFVYYFFNIDKMSLWLNKMASWARFDPCTIVWRPWSAVLLVKPKTTSKLERGVE